MASRVRLLRLCAAFLLVVVSLAGAVTAQTQATAPGSGGRSFQYTVFRPPRYSAAKTYPVVLLDRVGAEASGRGKAGLQALAARGWVVVVFRRSQHASLAAMVGHLRRHYRIATGRLFLPLPQTAELSEPKAWVAERPTDFHRLPETSGLDLAALLVKRRDALRPESQAQRQVAAVLDDFHDCAAKADGPRYFDHFAAKGVFLGTDPGERWPQAEFRAFGSKYFAGDSAWIYVPQQRHIDIAAGGEFAWFDESLHSDSYGVCRGTGALRKFDGVWKILQYHLSVPVPNGLMGEVVTMIRNTAKADRRRGATTVFLVRHAEKLSQGKDPKLTAAGQARAARLAQHLAPVSLAACYATQYARTKATVAPTCQAKSLSMRTLDARVDVAARILAEHRGEAVLVSGHSNTVPAILRRLGVRQRVKIGDSDYSDLFIVTIESNGRARLIRLGY